MSDLTMNQIIKRKAILEREIFLAIEAFEHETSSRVEEVSIDRIRFIGEEKSTISSVTTTVRL